MTRGKRRIFFVRLFIVLWMAGGFLPRLASGQGTAGSRASAESDFKQQNRPSVRLTLDSARAVSVGQFVSGTNSQEVKFPAPVSGRYFCLETLSTHDGRPYAAVAELDLLDPSGETLPRGEWRIAYVDSEERNREDGSAENALDANPATFWHTQWGSASPNHPHHLVLDLGKSRTVAGFQYLPRPGPPGAGGRIDGYRVYVGDDLVNQYVANRTLPSKFYLFGYFVGGTGEDGLHLAYSLNGTRWDTIDRGRSFLRTEQRFMRDPSLTRGPDGTFHLVWTASWAGTEIGYATSKDLLHWSEQRALPVMAGEPGAINCWAPELFWDAHAENFLVYWSSTLTNASGGPAGGPGRTGNRIYCATTKDFHAFSPPRLMYDPGFSVVDATLLPADGRFNLIFKDESSHRLRMASSPHPGGPYGRPGLAFTSGRVEGPTAFHIGDQYVISYSLMREERFGAVKSSDLQHWDDISSGMALPAGGHQGTVLELPGDVLRPLIEAGRFEMGPTAEASEFGLGDWIWATNVADKQTCRLWKEFEIPGGSQVNRAELRLTADNGYTAFLDGREIGRGGDVNCITEYDLTYLLSPGHHVLAVEAFNETMDAGVICGLKVKLADGKRVEVFSDPSWRVAENDARRWQTSRQSRPSWSVAQVVGYAGKAWWQYPYRIIQSPPLQPPVMHFWQRSWFLILLLVSCLAVLAVCVRLGLRLALQARAQQLVERERIRIARDIHDDLGAGLTQLTLLGELVLRDTPGEATTRNRLSDLCGKARLLLKSMDEIVWALNSRRDTVQDFAAFVSEETQEFLSTTPLRCRLEVAEELPAVPLDLPKRRNLMLAVKEAVHNAARHSSAGELTLKVRVTGPNLEVIVEDNGKGFVPEAARSGRNGLTNMNQRLLDIAGSCSVNSMPGAGCRVAFVLPLTELHQRSLSWLVGRKPSANPPNSQPNA